MKFKVIEDADVVTYVVVCDPGDEAVSGLTQFARAERLEAAQITAVGAFEHATVGWFDRAATSKWPRRMPGSGHSASSSGSSQTSVQLKVARYRVDEVVIVRADGQARPGGYPAELGQAPVGDQVDDEPGLERLAVHRQQLLLGAHLDGDLTEAARQPGSLGW